MSRVCALLLLLLCLVNNLKSQNITDEQGRRQGKWIEYYDDGSVKSTGSYLDGQPSGVFDFYNEDGALVARRVFSEDGATCDAEFYFQNGNVSARGRYVDKQRDGEWRYFDEASGSLILVETYKKGILSGKWVSYYLTGEPQFEGEYRDGVQVGEWRTYSPEGTVISIDKHENPEYSDPALNNVMLD